MKTALLTAILAAGGAAAASFGSESLRLPPDPLQVLERTCFQTAAPYAPWIDLRADVAIVYGLNPSLPERLKSWRERGYLTHVMTGVSWGSYQDYLYGRFDGANHEDEAQTERNGRKISHGGDVYYMCPGENFGKYLSQGVRRALEAGALAVHLEEPEFWARAGYSEGFKRQWRRVYGEPWQPPHASVDARWRAAKLKYRLYREALQQVFDSVRAYNREHGTRVRCYVPTHSLLNYAHWRIVSPESSLARLAGCDGYIAQVWTGTARTPNLYRGRLKERTFDAAFLEYGVMQNLVRATGRRVWFLHDPIEDNPNHDWEDYRRNWEATVLASLFHPEVWRYEAMPWPRRVFRGRYPRSAPPGKRRAIPPEYATEIQVVLHALNAMNQTSVRWDCGVQGIGLLASDSLMFERGDPEPSDPHLSHVYGLALPVLKRGAPLTPVQLENVSLPGYLDPFRILLLSYRGMKPLSPEPHEALASWVRAGGALLVWDDDGDPYNRVREWWNTNRLRFATPRQHLFRLLGLEGRPPGLYAVGKGFVKWVKADPARAAYEPDGDRRVVGAVRELALKAGIPWRETSSLILRRGPWLLAAGVEEADPALPARILEGKFLNLFDPKLRTLRRVPLEPGKRFFLLDLNRAPEGPDVLLAACKAVVTRLTIDALECAIEGVADTPGILAARIPERPRRVLLAGAPLADWDYEPAAKLLRVRFENAAFPRALRIEF
ncbi:MAG: hypothetical protein J7M29_11940 [Verrucomicrobia bacterium]|nr:hypothetical protein [Verrucomicrobiota bacterium]